MVRKIFGILAFALTALSLSVQSFAAKPDSKNPQAGKAAEKKTAAPGTKPVLQANAVSCTELSKLIDREISKKLTIEKISPSPKSTDSEFVRRVYLDILGRIPSAEETKTFLENTKPNKRALLIDELLVDNEYGKHMADSWQALLLPRISDNRRIQAEPLVKWLETEFNNNTPWNKIATELISSTGAQDKNGAVTYVIANASVDKITDSVSRLFLGVQLQCAQCHNHPFVDWKQQDYWGMATFFMKVQAKAPKGKDTSSPEVHEGKVVNRKKNALPESAKMVNAKFPAGAEPTLSSSDPYRPVFTNWLTAKSNPFFSRAMANRIWAQFFGKGLVDPIDDMHDGNPATHPELLEILASQFSASNFDLKHLVRSICNSETYQRSSKPNDSNKGADQALLATMPVKNLTPEQLYDSIYTVVGNTTGKAAAKAAKNKNVKGPNRGPRSQFVAFFQPEEGASPLNYETGIPQVLRLMNSPQMNSAQAITKILDKDMDKTLAIETIFLATLNRKPTNTETQRMVRFLEETPDRKQGYGDILWVLLNTSEFTLNH